MYNVISFRILLRREFYEKKSFEFGVDLFDDFKQF